MQYRRLLKTLHHLRTEVLEPAPGLLTEILANLEAAGERGAVRSLLSGRRGAYLGGLAAATAAGAAAGAIVLANRARKRVRLAASARSRGCPRRRLSSAGLPPKGSSSIWQSTGLQNRRLGVRVPPALLAPPRSSGTSRCTGSEIVQLGWR